ncbi:MAG TPA: class I SAM-dependent methyltransferase [Flavobacteriaceae bacterium]|nr:class I SAM-dependent methyltransferase [Flavobacteriaceae bacterium]
MATPTQSWYSSWFDTPYYHILYKDRDHNEAHDFMRNLVRFLELKKGASILDLACGKGRHSIYLNKLGFDVTGADLSGNSIAFAKQFENETLHFEKHDMCEPFGKRFDAVFNLFTSFGYFENPEDNLRTIKAIKTDLKPNGFGVIDFMNVDFVIENLVPSETKSRKGIDFHIERWVENGFIFKQIDFQDEGENFSFTEKVKALHLKDFQTYFEEAEVELEHVFGDYDLHDFDKESSPRLILIFRQ